MSPPPEDALPPTAQFPRSSGGEATGGLLVPEKVGRGGKGHEGHYSSSLSGSVPVPIFSFSDQPKLFRDRGRRRRVFRDRGVPGS